MDDYDSLLAAQKALRAAIVDQRELIEVVPYHGIDPEPFIDELQRLRRRLIVVQREIVKRDPD